MADRCPLPATGPSCLGLVAFGRTMPPSCMFRPRGFSPPRRLPPPEDAWACCIPLPILRFIGFPRRARRASVLPGLPRRCQTLQSLPHPYSRTRVTASRCPRVVSRLRSRCHRVLCDFKALLRTSSALRWSAVAGRPRPVALLGFPSWSITTVVPSWRPAAEADGGCARGPSRGTVRDVHAYPAAGPSDVRCAGEGRPREAVGTVEGGCARGEGPPALTHRRTGGHRRARGPGRTPGDHRRAGRPTASADHLRPPGCPDALRLPGTRCCGAPHHCGADLPKQAREASHHAGRRVRAIADLGAHRAGHPCGAGRERDGTGRGREAAPRALLTATAPLRGGPLLLR